MFGKLSPSSWSSGPNAGPAARLKSWTLDRNFNEQEGERLLKAGNFSASEVFFSKAAIDAEMRKRSALKRVHLRLLLAEAQRRQYRPHTEDSNFEKLLEAEATIRSALEIAGKNSERELYIQCLDALADIFADQSNFAAVEKVMQQAIKLEASLTHPDPVRMARRVLRLGVARHRLGRVEEALPALQKAVALHEQTYGADHEETANHLTELGSLYRAMGNHEEAQKCLRRALRIHERQGIDSPEAIQDLHHLAGSLEEAGDLESAAGEYERALTYKLRVIGSNLDDLAELQFGLASLYISWQNYARARELLYESIGTFRRRGGMRLAIACETLAHVEECSGRFNDAIKEMTVASKAWESLNPPRTRELIRNLDRRIELLEMVRKKAEASNLREKLLTLNAALEEEQRLAGVKDEIGEEFEMKEEPAPQKEDGYPSISLPLGHAGPNAWEGSG